MDTAFFGKVVPLAGQRKQFQPVMINPAKSSTWPKLQRMSCGRYERTWWMWGSYGDPIQAGRVDICVMDDFGFLVEVASGERTWW